MAVCVFLFSAPDFCQGLSWAKIKPVGVPFVLSEKHNFPVLGALLGGNPDAPKVSLQNCATFLHFRLHYILRFGRPDPNRREIAKYRVFRPFWPRTALGTKEIPGGKWKNANSHIETVNR